MRSRNRMLIAWCSIACLILLPHGCAETNLPDIRDMAPDLVVPEMKIGEPKPGVRVRQYLPGFEKTKVYHSLFLPTDFDSSKTHPIIIEFSGNGGYRSPYGDESIGRPEGSKLGYGIAAGKKFIWVCLPFINEKRDDIAISWWGDSPTFDANPTIDYCQKAIPWICEKHQGDPDKVFLAGFSRGAIACNFIGLHNDKISKLWCGFIAYSHYDGVYKWNFPGSDRVSARVRLLRLNGRPQFICHENNPSGEGLPATKSYLEETKIQGDFTMLETGFRNHNDAWTLRPSKAREELRKWVSDVVSKK